MQHWGGKLMVYHRSHQNVHWYSKHPIFFTAAPRQKGITDNFVKIELPPLQGPEPQYISVGIIKHPILDL